MNPDGSNPVTLTNNSADSDPAWSPDGRTIVLSWSLGPVAGLDAVRPSGTHLRALVRPRIHRGGVYGQPSWSRDGKRLAFVYYDSLARTRTITVSTSTGLRRHALTGLLDHPTPPGRLGRPQLVDGRLPACLLRRVRSGGRLRLDDPEPRREAAAAPARSLAAAQLGAGQAVRQWGGSALRCSPPYRSPLSSVAARHTMRAL